MCIMNNKFRFLDATNVILNALPFLIKDKIWDVGKKNIVLWNELLNYVINWFLL